MSVCWEIVSPGHLVVSETESTNQVLWQSSHTTKCIKSVYQWGNTLLIDYYDELVCKEIGTARQNWRIQKQSEFDSSGYLWYKVDPPQSNSNPQVMIQWPNNRVEIKQCV